jgi:hypothetical protein
MRSVYIALLYSCFFLLFLISIAYADLPLTVEDLITDKGKFKLDVSLTYTNTDQQGVSAGEPIVLQVGPTSFISVLSSVGESQNNSDRIVGTLGFRYGLTGKTEVYTRGSYLYSNNRYSDITGNNSTHDNYFTDAWAGLNYEFKKDDDTPALLGFLELAVNEKHRYDNAWFKSALCGLTTYKAIDPVVFSLTTAYRYHLSREDGEIEDYKPGNILLISPSVGFAVNDRVTLTTGLQWRSRQADRQDDQTIGLHRTSTDLVLGVGYGFTKDSTLNITNVNASGNSGTDLRINWLYTF